MTRSRSGQWLFGALTILILLIPLFFLSEQKISAAARPTISARLTTSSKYQGGTATVTASAAYGTAPYRYRFVYKVNGGRWVTIRNYSTTAKASFVYHTVGNYVVRSFVMDKSGLAAYYDLSFTVLEKELPLTNESTISAVKLNLGQTLSIAGKATGGTKPYYYAYYYTEYGSSQVTIQKKSTVSTASVKLPKAGYYSIKVIIWDGTGKSATKLFNITVSTVTGTALKNSSSISSAIIEAGGTITINGVGTGGTQPYLYSYSYSQDGIDYKTINSWTKFNSRTLKLTTPGYDKIKVTVKDLSGKSVTKTISVTCKRTTGRTLVNTSAIETTPITDGIRVHLIGSAYGGTEPYRYAFYYTLNNGKQKKVQSYSTNPKCTVDLKETGIYTLLLKVRDQAGTVVTKNYVISNGGPDSGMEQTTEGQKVIYGKLVTVTADNAGNGARYTFSCRHSSAADWTTLQKDSTSPATSFRPSLPGTYTIRIQANKNGTITTQTKTITAVIPDEVYRMLVLVNEERKAAGKPGYVLDTDLVYLAMIRSEEIQKKYSHIRPDGESFPTIFDEYYIGYSTTVGENIGQGFSTPEAVMKAWMKSTTHKSAILHDQYTKIGIGFDGKYWVQLFSD